MNIPYLVNFPKNIEKQSMSALAQDIQDILKANSLNFKSLITPAINYYETHHSLTALKALMFSLNTNQLKECKEVIALDVAKTSNIALSQALIDLQIVSLSDMIKSAIEVQNLSFLEVLFEKNYFLNQQEVKEFFLISLKFTPISFIEKLEKILDKKGLTVSFTDYIDALHVIQNCLMGNYCSNLDYAISKVNPSYVTSDTGLFAIESVIEANLSEKLPKEQLELFNYLDSKWNNWIEQNTPIVFQYINSLMETQAGLDKKYVEIIDFFIEKKWISEDSLMDLVSSLDFNSWQIDEFFSYYHNEYPIIKEKINLESAILTNSSPIHKIKI